MCVFFSLIGGGGFFIYFFFFCLFENNNQEQNNKTNQTKKSPNEEHDLPMGGCFYFLGFLFYFYVDLILMFEIDI